VGVTITVASPAKTPDKVPIYMPKSLKRDTRADPFDDMYNCQKLATMATPTKETMKLAWDEMRPLVNLVPYYTEDWGPILSRHRAMLEAIEAGKAKDAKGLMKQIVEAYKKVMKTGKWQPGPWGKEEPK
jgi:hypothetical protein